MSSLPLGFLPVLLKIMFVLPQFSTYARLHIDLYSHCPTVWHTSLDKAKMININLLHFRQSLHMIKVALHLHLLLINKNCQPSWVIRFLSYDICRLQRNLNLLYSDKIPHREQCKHVRYP